MGASISATTCFPEGSRNVLAFKNGIKQNMARCHWFKQRLWSVSGWTVWPHEGSVVANSPVPLLRPELPPKSSCFGWTGCPFAYCCQVLAGGRRAGSVLLPCSPARAGQCLRKQPCPRPCWRNSGFAFKERRFYQNYFSQNAKRFFVSLLLLSPSYLQAVKW